MIARLLATLVHWLQHPLVAPRPPAQFVSEHWLKTHFYLDGKEARE